MPFCSELSFNLLKDRGSMMFLERHLSASKWSHRLAYEETQYSIGGCQVSVPKMRSYSFSAPHMTLLQPECGIYDTP